MRPARLLAASSALLLVVLSLSAADAADALKGRTYYFGTHPARTNVTFVSEADLETIHGVTNQAEGSVTIDKEGTSATGSIRAAVAGLKTGIDLRDEHLRSDAWLDAKKHPWLSLALVSVTEDKGGKTWSYEADLTIKGTTKRIAGTARVTPIPDALGKQLGAGSWVRVRTAFDVKLSEYGVEIPQQLGAKVSEVWKVGVDLYGTTAQPKPTR